MPRDLFQAEVTAYDAMPVHPSEVPTMPIELDEVGQVLLKAAQLIERHGLAKETRLSTEGAFCLHGAISMAACGDPDQDSIIDGLASMAFVEYLARNDIYKSPTRNGAAFWNNAPERTASEVISALTSCAMTRKRGR